MFSSSRRSPVYSAIAEKLTMSPTTISMCITVTCRRVIGPRAVTCPSVSSVAANRRDRNSSSAGPRRTRSPGVILTGMDRSIRCPLSRVPFVLKSVSQA